VVDSIQQKTKEEEEKESSKTRGIRRYGSERTDNHDGFLKTIVVRNESSFLLYSRAMDDCDGGGDHDGDDDDDDDDDLLEDGGMAWRLLPYWQVGEIGQVLR